MQNPFDQFDGPAAGPIMGPPPKVDPYKARDQELQEAAAVRAEQDQAMQREKFEWEKNKPGAGGDPKLVEAERTAAFLATRVAGGMQDLSAALAQEPGAAKPGLGASIAGVFGETAQGLVQSPARRQVEAAQADILDAALTLGTGAAYTAHQLEGYRKAYFPSLTDDPQTIAGKKQRLARLLEAAKLKAGNAAPQIDEAIAALNGPAADQGMDRSANPTETTEGNNGTDQLQPSTGGYETVNDPKLSGVRGEYLRRLAEGQSAGQLIKYLREAGINDPEIFRSAAKQAEHLRKYPNTKISQFNTASLDDMDVPLSAAEQGMNAAGQSALGAAAISGGNAVTMNNLDSLVGMTGGNEERARLGIEDAGRNHPVASTVGSITGGVTAALGAEAGLAGLGMAGGAARALTADTLYGAGAGAGAADGGDRLSGAAQGGLAGIVGSGLGQVATRGVGTGMSPTGGSLSDLYASGVRPTPGQRFVNAGDGKGLAGLAGRALNATEEGLSSVPIVGSAIRGARQDARDQFQIGAFNEALKEVGEQLPKGMKVGTAPHAYSQKVFDKVYDKARSGMRLGADEELNNQVTELANEVVNLSEPSIRRFDNIVKNVVMRRVKGNSIDGKDYKAIQSELGKQIRSMRASQSGDGELAEKLEDLSGMLDSAARRHSDPEAVKLLDAADAGYAKFVRIEQAAANRGGDAGTFTPTQFDRSVQKMSGRVRSKAYLRGDALMQDYAEQGMSLVDRQPNSGTADRMMVGAGAAGGAALLEPGTLGLLGVLGTLYAPGVRKATTGAMAPRGGKSKALGNSIKKRARIAGAVGAGVAVSGQTDDDQ